MEEKLDKTIEVICDWLEREVGKVGALNCSEVTLMTKALADLVSARAQCI